MNPPKKPPTNPESGRIFAETCRPRAAGIAKSLPISFADGLKPLDGFSFFDHIVSENSSRDAVKNRQTIPRRPNNRRFRPKFFISVCFSPFSGTAAEIA
jgi:hypothetical protein